MPKEYLKCFDELTIMKGLNEVEIRFEYSAKTSLQAGFCTSGHKITSKCSRSQRFVNQFGAFKHKGTGFDYRSNMSLVT
jgi:hypothetical protein